MATLKYNKNDYAHAVEAKHDLLIVLKPCDIKNATKGNPKKCAFAKAAKRLFGAKHPVFFAQIAYVDIPDKHGKMVTHRYTMPSATQRLISEFDAGKPIQDASYLLRAPTPARTREAGRTANDKNRTRVNKKPESVAKPRPRRIKKAHSGRDGTGKVQFHFDQSEKTRRVI